jgi:hypothetical protein
MVGVGVAVAVLVGVFVGVFVGVRVGVFVGVRVGVFVGVGVGVTALSTNKTSSKFGLGGRVTSVSKPICQFAPFHC